MKSFIIPLLLSSLFSWVYAAQRNFVLDLTWKVGAPDGVERYMIFINDQFPGPLLEAEEGDEVEVGSPLYHKVPSYVLRCCD